MMPAVESAKAGKERLAKMLVGKARNKAALFRRVFIICKRVVELIRLKSCRRRQDNLDAIHFSDCADEAACLLELQAPLRNELQ